MIKRFLPQVDHLELDGSTVLLRVDLNVPFVQDNILDNNRIQKIKKTVDFVIQQGAKIILISHLGRPKGKFDPTLSLQKIVSESEKILQHKIHFSGERIGSMEVQKKIDALPQNEILLFENIRFYPQEEQNDNAFVLKLANLGDFYINDAFSCSHRNHASIVGLPSVMKSAFGFAFIEELQALDEILSSDSTPIGAIIGGAKVSTKLELLEHLINKFDFLLLAGAMANTFLVAQNKNLGKSVYDYDSVHEAKNLLALAQEKRCELILPSDAVIVNSFEDEFSTISSIDEISPEQMIVDIGPQTIQNFSQQIEKCQTILWNGPLGAYEYKSFDVGTTSIARFLINLTQKQQIKSVVGGGDSIAALRKMNIPFDDFNYVSTSGGAFIYWLVHGDDLPGLKAIAGKK